MNRRYSELQRLHTFEDRFAYLRLHGQVGSQTFGHDRFINQNFYHSAEWKSVRDFVIVRDNGCDLGISGYEIATGLLVHHMEPMSISDLVHSQTWVLDPEYLITTTLGTHNAIHFGVETLTPKTVTERKPGDTKLW